jgi:hypothetical protein
MKYLLLSKIDRVVEGSVVESSLPEIEGLQVEFYNESEWPTDNPLAYCTAETKAKITTEQPGVVEVLTKKEFLDRRDLEFSLRYEKLSATAKHNRSICYQTEADPLFFKYQRGDATKEEWLAKVEEIKARFPLSEDEPTSSSL